MVAPPQLAVCHAGYRPDSPKMITLVPEKGSESQETEIPFIIRRNAWSLARDRRMPPGAPDGYQSPFDLVGGRLLPEKFAGDEVLYRGVMIRVESRWGTVWQADFSDFTAPGAYQIDTDAQTSVPFMIHKKGYDRVLLGYLRFLSSQRCGCEVFGVHPACHLDDGILDDGKTLIDATGGWHDAGDFRKWLFFTQYHLGALVMLYQHRFANGKPAQVGPDGGDLLDEIRWGNKLFHNMITGEGKVFEDVGGGKFPDERVQYPDGWWFENHPGLNVNASDCRWTDNVPRSGDERMVRTTLNPLVQFGFVHVQSMCARVLPEAESSVCRALAERAWRYGEVHAVADKRTLFLSARLRAACELIANGCQTIDPALPAALAEELLSRQESDAALPLTGYFYEEGRTDAYRSIAFANQPPMALLRLWEVREMLPLPEGMTSRLEVALRRYIDGYLLADAESNPFGVTPFGIYLHPDKPDLQNYRPAGNGRWVRTFMPPFNKLNMAHGLSGHWMNHAHLMARAGRNFGESRWQRAAERLLQWTLGHNVDNASLFDGIGYRQSIPFSMDLAQLPDGVMTGYIGDFNDCPYQERSTAIWWSTQEYWSTPYIHAVAAICCL